MYLKSELKSPLVNKNFESINENDEKSSYPPKSFRAAIYVGRAIQNQENYIMSELEACEKYIRQRGWVACDLFAEKNHITAGDNNPILQLMLERAKSGCFDALVVSNLSMLSWSSVTFDKVSKFLNDYNVALYSATEPVPRADSNSFVNRQKGA